MKSHNHLHANATNRYVFFFLLGRDPVTGEPLESNDWNDCEKKAAKVTTCCINPDEVPDGCPNVDDKD